VKGLNQDTVNIDHTLSLVASKGGKEHVFKLNKPNDGIIPDIYNVMESRQSDIQDLYKYLNDDPRITSGTVAHILGVSEEEIQGMDKAQIKDKIENIHIPLILKELNTLLIGQ